MSEILKDRAVILRTYDFGESSVVVVALTREHGKVKLLAKGAKRQKSQFFGHLRTGNLVEVVFYFREQRGLQLLKEVAGQRSFDFDGEDLEKLCIFQAGLEVVERSIIESDADEKLFDLLEDFVTVLPTAEDMWMIFFTLEIQMLQNAGLYPSTSECIGCHKPLAGEALGINPRSGDVTCRICCRDGTVFLSPASCDMLTRMERGSFRDIEKLKLGLKERREIGEILHRLYLYHIDGYRLPNALRILKAVN